MTKALFSSEDFNVYDDPSWASLRDLCAEHANDKHEAECPYKPRIDNDNGNEYAMVMALKEENAGLREALNLFDFQNRSRGYPTGSEWIELMKKARVALEGK